nr:hypothetical protein Cry52Nrm2_p087 [Cryptomonas curvata]
MVQIVINNEMPFNFNFLINHTEKSIGSFDLSCNLIFNYIQKNQRRNLSKFLIIIYILLIKFKKRLFVDKVGQLLSFLLISQISKKEKIGLFTLLLLFILKLFKTNKKVVRICFFRIFSMVIIFLHNNCIFETNFFFLLLSILTFNSIIKNTEYELKFSNIFSRLQFSGTEFDIINIILIKIFSSTNLFSVKHFIENVIKLSSKNCGFCIRFFFFQNYPQSFIISKNKFYKRFCLITQKQKEILKIYEKNTNTVVQGINFLSNVKKILLTKKLIFIKKSTIFVEYLAKKTKKKRKLNLFKVLCFTYNIKNKKRIYFNLSFPIFSNSRKIKNQTLINLTKLTNNFNMDLLYKELKKLNFIIRLLDLQISDLNHEIKIVVFLLENYFHFLKKFIKILINILYDWIADFTYKKKKFFSKLNMNLANRKYIYLNCFVNMGYKFKKFGKTSDLIIERHFKTTYRFLGLYMSKFFTNFIHQISFFNSKYKFESIYMCFNRYKFFFDPIELYDFFFSILKLNKRNLIQKKILNINFKFYFSRNVIFFILFYHFILTNLKIKDNHNFSIMIQWINNKIIKKRKIKSKFIFFGIKSKVKNYKFSLKLLWFFFFTFYLLPNSTIYLLSYFFDWIYINGNIIRKFFLFNRIYNLITLLATKNIAFTWLSWSKTFFCLMFWNNFRYAVLIFVSSILKQKNLFTEIKKSLIIFFIDSIHFLNFSTINFLYWKKKFCSILYPIYFIYFLNYKNITLLASSSIKFIFLFKTKKNLKKKFKMCWKLYFNYLQE